MIFELIKNNLIIGLIVWLMIISSIVGATIGRYKNKAFLGFLLGLFLGPVGWIIIIYINPSATDYSKLYKKEITHWVEPVIRFLKYHEDISENKIFTQSIPYEIKFNESFKSIKSILNFFDNVIIPHFEFEENIIFPTILSKLKSNHYEELIANLKDDHLIILKKLEIFKKTATKTIDIIDEITLNTLNSLLRDIRITILEHATKEDFEIFPILKQNQDLFRKYTL